MKPATGIQVFRQGKYLGAQPATRPEQNSIESLWDTDGGVNIGAVDEHLLEIHIAS